jgi:biopolymer transport protein ExbB/TolQ
MTQPLKPAFFTPPGSVSLSVQILLFLGVVITVALPYHFLIRPEAEAVRARNQAAAQVTETAFVPERSLAVIIGDYEQQICFTLMLWGLILLAGKFNYLRRERKAWEVSYVNLKPGQKIIPESALQYYQQLRADFPDDSTEGRRLLPRIIKAALLRLEATRSLQEVSESIRDLTQATADQLETDLSLLRYIAWAIPSFGFIGTVRGIGEALLQADQAVRGDVSGVTAALGVAFNSTFIALVLSIPLMLLIHALQQKQEMFTLAAEDYARTEVAGRMKIPS